MPWEYNARIESFTLYHMIQEEAHHEEDQSIGPAFGHAIAGAAGSAVSNFMVYPLTLAIARLQTQKKAVNSEKVGSSKPEYKGLADTIAKVSHDEGLPALYNGLAYDTAKTVADSFLFFLAYNFLSRWRKRNLGEHTGALRALDDIAIGIASGAFSKAITSPLSQIVTRKQTASRGSDGSKSEPSVLEVLRQIRKTKGIQGLWSGYSAQLVMTLNPSITMFLDKVLTRLARLGDGGGALATFLVAAISKSIATVIMYPVGLAKTRAQAEAGNASSKSSGPGGVLLTLPKLAREQGIGALYAGVDSEVIKGFLQHGLTMVVKDRIHTLVIQLYFLLLNRFKKSRKDVIVRP